MQAKKAGIIQRLLSIDTYYAILREEIKSGRRGIDLILKFIASLIVSMKNFIANAGSISASGLTMYSLISLVPIIALVLGIANGFGAKSLLEEQIRSNFFTNPEVGEWVIQFADTALENSKGGLIAGVGIVMLLWSVIKVMSTLELIMNRIWRVKEGRRMAKKFVDYLSVFFIAPIFLIVICGCNVFISTNIETLGNGDQVMKFAGTALGSLVEWTPYVLTWLLFTFVYMFVPTTPVKFKHAIIAGILAGTLFQLSQWAYIKFQIGVSSYSAMYGSLAALPLLLAWMQVSWSIVVWGTELCYVLRDGQYIAEEKRGKYLSWTDRVNFSVQILRFIAQNYKEGRGSTSLESMTHRFKMGSGELSVLLQLLIDRDILEVVPKEQDTTYLPNVDLHNVSFATIILRMSDINSSPNEAWQKKYVKVVEDSFGDERFL